MTNDYVENELVYAGDLDSPRDGEKTMESPVAILRRALRGRLLVAIVLGSIIGAGLAVAGYRSAEPLYRSAGVVEVIGHQPRILFRLEEKARKSDAFIDTQVSLVKDPRVISQVMRGEMWQSAGRGISPEEIAEFQSSLSAQRIAKTSLIRVSFVDRSPGMAQRTVNAVIDAFLVLSAERESTSERGRFDTLEAERIALRQKLQDLAEEERARSDGLGAAWVDSQYQRRLSDLADLGRRMRDKQLEIDSLRSALPTGSDDPDGGGELTPESLALRSEGMAALLRARGAAEADLRVLREELKLGGRDPRVIAARAQLDSVNEQIDNVLAAARERASGSEGVLSDAELQLERAKAELAQLQASHAEMESALKPTAKMWTSLQSILQERAGIRTELDRVLARQRELDVELGGQDESGHFAARVNRVHEAEWPGMPFSDKRMRHALMGAFGGFGLGFLLVAAFGLLRGQMRHVEDVVGNAARDRFLAIVPDATASSKDDLPRTSAEMTEYCVHHLRSLLQLRTEEGSRTIVMTSPSAGAGKTTIGMALALSFGAAGSRTLLVDCDLVGHGLSSAISSVVFEGARAALEACATSDTLDGTSPGVDAGAHVRKAFAAREMLPSEEEISALLDRVREASSTGSSRARAAFRALEAVARYRGINGFAPGRRVGLMEAISGHPIEECVLDTGFENVTVLPVGEAKASDAERLSPTHVERLLKTCHGHYDIVILDTGPVLGSLEASFVSAVADDVVCIVSRGEPRKLAVEALKRLDRLGARVSGVVFNRALVGDVVRSSYTSRSGSVVGDRA